MVGMEPRLYWKERDQRSKPPLLWETAPFPGFLYSSPADISVPQVLSFSLRLDFGPKWAVVVVQSLSQCLTLCNPMDCSPPGSSVHGISRARILKWVAISFSRESSLLRSQTRVSCIGRQILYHWVTWEVLSRQYNYISVFMFWVSCVLMKIVRKYNGMWELERSWNRGSLVILNFSFIKEEPLSLFSYFAFLLEIFFYQKTVCPKK